MQQVRVLPVDVSEYLDRCLKLDKRLFLFELFLHFFNQELNHLDWEVDEWH